MDSNDSGNNSFGEFLSALRTSRGFANVSEYLRSYPLGISSVHYRNLESGERNISIEGAKQLCKALQADPKSFYFSLLKDWLPQEFMDLLVPLSENQNDAALSYQKAIMRIFESQTLYPDEQSCVCLEQNFQLMPIVWFIYSLPEVRLVDIEKLALQLNISEPAQAIVDQFLKLGLIELVEANTSSAVRRIRPIISFVHHSLGKKILQHETKQFQNVKDSVMFYSLMSMPAAARQTMFRRIQEFVQEVCSAAEETYLSSTDESEPVFYSVVFAPRPQYKAEPFVDENIADQPEED